MEEMSAPPPIYGRNWGQAPQAQQAQQQQQQQQQQQVSLSHPHALNVDAISPIKRAQAFVMNNQINILFVCSSFHLALAPARQLEEEDQEEEDQEEEDQDQDTQDRRQSEHLYTY